MKGYNHLSIIKVVILLLSVTIYLFTLLYKVPFFDPNVYLSISVISYLFFGNDKNSFLKSFIIIILLPLLLSTTLVLLSLSIITSDTYVFAIVLAAFYLFYLGIISSPTKYSNWVDITVKITSIYLLSLMLRVPAYMLPKFNKSILIIEAVSLVNAVVFVFLLSYFIQKIMQKSNILITGNRNSRKLFMFNILSFLLLIFLSVRVSKLDMSSIKIQNILLLITFEATYTIVLIISSFNILALRVSKKS